VKYIYGRAFRAPNVYENYYADGIVVEAPTKLLMPETMGSNEVILERGLSSWLQATVDVSYNHLQDLIDQVPDPATGLSHFVNDRPGPGTDD
jgi:outer membrane receptor for ferrienterochelin and colicins